MNDAQPTRGRIRASALVLLACLTALVVPAAAGAHQSGCHSSHSCPSDHHSYIWYDGAGVGHDCAEPGAPEYNPATDTSTIVYSGLTYYCLPVGGTSPPPAPPPPPPPPPSPTPPPPGPAPSPRCHIHGKYPDPHCTPGAIFTTATTAQVCQPGYSSRVRDVSQATKNRVDASYGIHQSGRYEVDHLIPLELGGANTVANLWPEPYRGPAGARVKDRLENALHRDVCAGRVGLRVAQREIATNWYRAYLNEGRP